MPLDEAVRQLYEREFSAPSAVVACAPGRLEVLGNHTDYNEGLVLAAAIEQSVWVATGRTATATMELCSRRHGRASVRPDAPAAAVAPWARYAVGVFRSLEATYGSLPPVQAAIDGDLPPGVGLASSAAVTVACALAWSELFDLPVEPLSIARVCQQAEQRYAGTRCGLLDPLAALWGREGQLLEIDFRTLSHRGVPWPTTKARLVVACSGVARPLAESAYNDRRAACELAVRQLKRRYPDLVALRDVTLAQLRAAESALDPVAFRRACHVVGEIERVAQARACLATQDLAGLGQLLWASHHSSVEQFDNSCAELDTLVDIARDAAGVLGSRLSGGGFGGATITLVEAAHASDLANTLPPQFARRTGRRAAVLCVSPATAARIVHS